MAWSLVLTLPKHLSPQVQDVLPSSPINFRVGSAFPFLPAMDCWMPWTPPAKVRMDCWRKLARFLPRCQGLSPLAGTANERMKVPVCHPSWLPSYLACRPNWLLRKFMLFWHITSAWLLRGYFSAVSLPLTLRLLSQHVLWQLERIHYTWLLWFLLSAR